MGSAANVSRPERTATGARRGVARALRGLAVTLVVAASLACGDLKALLGGGGPLDVEAKAKLTAGDLPGAAQEYERLFGENPESVDLAVGLAYTKVLQGDYEAADAALRQVEDKAGDKAGEIKLRRALVALDAHQPEKVADLGVASGLPEGKLLAAEFFLIDLQEDKAKDLLGQISGEPGIVGETAKTYLDMLTSGNQHQAALAEAAALWALGDRKGAVGSVEESLKSLPEEDPTKPAQILLWAGRAATAGRPDVTASLLDQTFPPEGQRWRYNATKAIGLVASADLDGAVVIFEGLENDPETPKDGLRDALATACALAPKEGAQRLVEGMESAAAARCLLQAGAVDAAKARATDGAFQKFLESQ